MHRHLLALAVPALLLIAPAAHADTQTYKATMNAASEVPPKNSPGTGSCTVTLDPANKTISWSVSWQDLSGAPTMAHFHGPAAPGKNAPPAVWIGKAPMNSPATGRATLTDTQMAQLQAGKWYCNVHTEKNPAGEIRGQLTRGD